MFDRARQPRPADPAAARGDAFLSKPPTWRFLLGLIAMGFVWRLVVDSRTVMPREDGVNYLWMAERFASGEFSEALGEIFSPLLAIAIALPVALNLEPFAAGQLSLAILGACVVVPVAKIGEELQAGVGRAAGLLCFFAARPVLLGSQIYTEPLFLLVAGFAFLAGLRRRYLACGALAGLAFWVRPEAAVIPVVFVLAHWRTSHLRPWSAFVPLALAIAVLAVWRGACGHGFDPVPKLQFIMAHNVAAAQSGWERLVQVPGTFLEAFGAIAILAIPGIFKKRPAPVMWMLLLATIIIWAYVPRRRFFVNWLFAVTPMAAIGLSCLPRKWGCRWWALSVVLALELAQGWTGGSDPGKLVERGVAEHLRGLLKPGEIITGDMTRVQDFAGFRPLQPRHYTADEVISAAREARFVVVRIRNASPGGVTFAEQVRRGLPRFEWMSLPDELREKAGKRGMRVLRRTQGR